MDDIKFPDDQSEPDQIPEGKLDEVSGGTVINPQPLPPRHNPEHTLPS